MTVTVTEPPARDTNAGTHGVAVVMPAYREELNLADTVIDFLYTLSAAGIPHTIVVVDDGSPDRTGEILDKLADRFHGRVLAVHHTVNQGYGGAVRSGIAAALESTRHGYVLLTDADRQFRAADLPYLLRAQRRERADAVIGFRERRADPWHRRLNAWLWTKLSRLVLGVPSRDVDCAYKLIDRRLLEGLELSGEAAAISPELLAKINVDEAHIIEHPVSHYPREYGEQTGARPAVILRSLLSLFGVYFQLVAGENRLRWLTRLLRPEDPWLRMVTWVAAALSVTAYLVFLNAGAVLAYRDASSHLLIARRVLFSPSSGLAQLGGVWLPLPHVLSLPLAWYEPFYTSGFAGALVSMVAYVVTVRYMFRLGRAVGGSAPAGLIAALGYACNANVLYLQSTAMTESLLFACVAATVYHLHRWCLTSERGDFVAASVAIFLATLTRYEGWILCIAALAVVGYTELRRHRSYIRAEAALVFFGFVAVAGIAGWVVWNLVIFGDPLNWISGEYADSSLWVDAGEAAVGNLDVAARTYSLAVHHNLGIATIVCGALGLIAYAARYRARPQAVAMYSLSAFGVFFVCALYSGQRPLHVKEISGELYNVRFGLIMVLPAAVFAAYLAGRLPVLIRRATRVWIGRVPRMALSAGIAASVFAVPGIVTLEEALDFRSGGTEVANAAAGAWLRENYDGGNTLMTGYGNEPVTFDSQVPTESIIYEGSYLLWEKALVDPLGADVVWIYMRALPGKEDGVWHALYGTRLLSDHYELVYDHADRLIYRIKEGTR